MPSLSPLQSINHIFHIPSSFLKKNTMKLRSTHDLAFRCNKNSHKKIYQLLDKECTIPNICNVS